MQKLFITIGVFFFGVSVINLLTLEEGEPYTTAIFFALLGVAFLIISAIPEVRRKIAANKTAERLEESKHNTKKKIAMDLYKDFESRGILHLSTADVDEVMKIAKDEYAIIHFSDLQSYYYYGRRLTREEREIEASGKSPKRAKREIEKRRKSSGSHRG